jgi:hypothetical protein
MQPTRTQIHKRPITQLTQRHAWMSRSEAYPFGPEIPGIGLGCSGTGLSPGPATAEPFLSV